jgi:four helix bundle protein
MENSNSIQCFEDLVVWQEALEVSKNVFFMCAKGPLKRDFILNDQIRRSSLSILSNIAEGFGRYGKQDFRHYLSIANGSANELRAQLHLVKELGYWNLYEIEKLIDACAQISRMIKGLRNTINT